MPRQSPKRMILDHFISLVMRIKKAVGIVLAAFVLLRYTTLNSP